MGPTAAARGRADRADPRRRRAAVALARWRPELLSAPVQVAQRYGDGGLRLVGPVLTTVEPDARSHVGRLPSFERRRTPRMTRSTIRRCPAPGRGPAIANAGPVDALTPRVGGEGRCRGERRIYRARIPASRRGAVKLNVVVHQADEGGYWAEVPSIPGCATQGDTLKELLKNVREAVEGCLSVEVRDVPRSKTDRIVEITV